MHESQLYDIRGQAHLDRVQGTSASSLRRRLIAQRRARKRLEKAERAALRARLVLAATPEVPAVRLTERRA